MRFALADIFLTLGLPCGGIRICLYPILTSKTLNPIIRPAYYTPSLHRNILKDRNINLFSIGFPCPKTWLSLGTPNPPMIAIAEETLGFRRSGLSPDLRLLIPTFSLPSAPACFTTHLHCSLECSPTVNGNINISITHRIGTMLKPR